MTRLILAAVALRENRRRCIIVLAEDAMSALVRLILNRSREKSFHTPRNVLSGERWPGMTKGRNKKTKAKVEFTGWKAPNKRKHLVGTKAQSPKSLPRRRASFRGIAVVDTGRAIAPLADGARLADLLRPRRLSLAFLPRDGREHPLRQLSKP